jgi:hypothetical protein
MARWTRRLPPREAPPRAETPATSARATSPRKPTWLGWLGEGLRGHVCPSIVRPRTSCVGWALYFVFVRPTTLGNELHYAPHYCKDNRAKQDYVSPHNDVEVWSVAWQYRCCSTPFQPCWKHPLEVTCLDRYYPACCACTIYLELPIVRTPFRGTHVARS